jgi:Na+-translocating ferredoxin:NAD+ oxidoreductase subunit B
MTKLHDLGAKIDALLPQTQCGLCEYPGCKPYAEAIVEKGERIDRCLPGGVEVLIKLGELLRQDPSPYIPDMKKNQKSESLVVIREEACIGCKKCIQACPVDAIIGGAKLMHTVISDACTGCDLCIEPCPVDCIDIVKIPARNEEEKKRLAEKSRERYENRKARLARLKKSEAIQHQEAKLVQESETLAARKRAIQEAILRAREKKKP